MRNSEVAKRFIESYGTENLTGSNFYSSGGNLYSYSTVIAFFRNGIPYINTRSYSVTTSKHQAYVKNAMDGKYKPCYYEG